MPGVNAGTDPWRPLAESITVRSFAFVYRRLWWWHRSDGRILRQYITPPDENGIRRIYDVPVSPSRVSLTMKKAIAEYQDILRAEAEEKARDLWTKIGTIDDIPIRPGSLDELIKNAGN